LRNWLKCFTAEASFLDMLHLHDTYANSAFELRRNRN
jgi:hypothetical protein